MPGPKRIRLKVMLDAPSKELTRSLTKRIRKYEPAEVQQRLNSAADKDSSRWEVLEVSRAVVPTAKSLSPEFTV